MIVFQSNVIKVEKNIDEIHSVGVARVFDWGEGQNANHTQWLHQKFLEKKTIYVGQRYRRMEDQKPRPGLARNLDFAKEKGLESKVKKISKLSKLGNLSKLV